MPGVVSRDTEQCLSKATKVELNYGFNIRFCNISFDVIFLATLDFLLVGYGINQIPCKIHVEQEKQG